MPVTQRPTKCMSHGKNFWLFARKELLGNMESVSYIQFSDIEPHNVPSEADMLLRCDRGADGGLGFWPDLHEHFYGQSEHPTGHSEWSGEHATSGLLRHRTFPNHRL